MKLVTARLVIRPFTIEDAPFLLELINTPSWIKYIGDRKIRSLKKAAKYIEDSYLTHYEKNTFGLYLVELKDSKIPIGMCGLINREGLDDIDIGFGFLPAYEGMGYAFESASIWMQQAEEVFKLPRVVAITATYNERSINLLKRLGLTFEKTIQLSNDEEKLYLFSRDF